MSASANHLPTKGDSGIWLDSVSKSFSSPDAGSIPVFENLSVTFEPNQLHVVMGASGCGKSTLGYLLAGFIPPDQGSVGLGDKLVKNPGPERLLVFQETALWPWMTVLDNVVFGPKVRGDTDAASAKSAAQALLQVEQGPCEPCKGLISKSGERESQRDPKRARESQRESERIRESQREPKRARESQREPERTTESHRDSLSLPLVLSLALYLALWLDPVVFFTSILLFLTSFPACAT